MMHANLGRIARQLGQLEAGGKALLGRQLLVVGLGLQRGALDGATSFSRFLLRLIWEVFAIV
jgi:hypothetical protein